MDRIENRITWGNIITIVTLIVAAVLFIGAASNAATVNADDIKTNAIDIKANEKAIIALQAQNAVTQSELKHIRHTLDAVAEKMGVLP